jgi:hypothetical protein
MARRLWTLQESLLAKSLWLQLKDGPVDLYVLQLQLYETRAVHHALISTLTSALNRMRKRVKMDFGSVKQTITRRSVSVPSDETLCLCTCLNIDQEQVVKAPLAERMETFWAFVGKTRPKIHRGIAFFAGPHLKKQGQRWAPASLLNENVTLNGLRLETYLDELATITPTGLSAQFAAFTWRLFDSPSEILREIWDEVCPGLSCPNDVFWIRRKSGEWYMLSIPKDLITVPQPNVREVMQTFNGSSTVLLQGWSSQALLGDVTGYQRDIPVFHGVALGMTTHTNPRTAYCLDKALVLSKSDAIKDIALTDCYSHSSAFRGTVMPTIPIASESRLLDMVRKSLTEDLEAAKIYIDLRSEEQVRNNIEAFAHFLLLALCGRFGEITHEWDKSQDWYLD